VGSWDEMLPLVEFTYKYSYNANIGMTPYEALYGRKCKTFLCWYHNGETVLVGLQLIQQITKKVK